MSHGGPRSDQGAQSAAEHDDRGPGTTRRAVRDPAGEQGLLFDDAGLRAARGRRLSRAHGVRGCRHHVPPARLLGAHRPGRGRASAQPAAPGRSASTASATSSCCAWSSACSTPASRSSRSAAQSLTCASAASTTSPQITLHERRRHASTSARRPTRSSTSSRAGRACSRSPWERSGARSKARWPSCRGSAPPIPRMLRPSRRSVQTTSCPSAAAAVPPPDASSVLRLGHAAVVANPCDTPRVRAIRLLRQAHYPK